jgi:hypothetical protein
MSSHYAINTDNKKPRSFVVSDTIFPASSIHGVVLPALLSAAAPDAALDRLFPTRSTASIPGGVPPRRLFPTLLYLLHPWSRASMQSCTFRHPWRSHGGRRSPFRPTCHPEGRPTGALGTMVASRVSLRETLPTSSRSRTKRAVARMSVADGSTGIRMVCVRRTSAVSSAPCIPAGASRIA